MRRREFISLAGGARCAGTIGGTEWPEGCPPRLAYRAAGGQSDAEPERNARIVGGIWLRRGKKSND